MQRPEEQPPQAIADARPQKVEMMPAEMSPPMKGMYMIYTMKAAGAVLVVLAAFTLFKLYERKSGSGMDLMSGFAAVFVALIGAGLLQTEKMTVLTGQLVHKAFPGGFPKTGPADNGQLYGQNMILDPKAKDPQQMFYPFPSSSGEGMKDESTMMNTPIDL